MTIKALIFDFDGLILDTETPEIEGWQSVYEEHGLAYPMELGALIIGGFGRTDFDPVAELQRQAPRPLDLKAIRQRHRQMSDARILNCPVLPGVAEVLAVAQQLGLRRAVASSSDRKWVENHLTRLGLIANFERLVTADDVEKGRTKPHPDLYLKALQMLDLRAGEAMALEDSPNGILAAHAAGLRVIAVPNPVTAALGLKADLVLGSLAELPLNEMLRRVGGEEALSSSRPQRPIGVSSAD